MGKNVISSIEVAVIVFVASEGFFGILDQVQGSKGVAQSVLDRKSSSRYGVVGIVVPGESVPMCQCEKRHFKADEGVLDSGSQVVDAVARHVVRNGAQPNKDGEEETLPVGCEDDAFDAQKLGHGPEGLQVFCHAHPEHGESVQTDCDAHVVDEALPEIA